MVNVTKFEPLPVGLPLESQIVAVIVEMLVPFAVIDAGVADTTNLEAPDDWNVTVVEVDVTLGTAALTVTDCAFVSDINIAAIPLLTATGLLPIKVAWPLWLNVTA